MCWATLYRVAAFPWQQARLGIAQPGMAKKLFLLRVQEGRLPVCCSLQSETGRRLSYAGS